MNSEKITELKAEIAQVISGLMPFNGDLQIGIINALSRDYDPALALEIQNMALAAVRIPQMREPLLSMINSAIAAPQTDAGRRDVYEKIKSAIEDADRPDANEPPGLKNVVLEKISDKMPPLGVIQSVSTPYSAFYPNRSDAKAQEVLAARIREIVSAAAAGKLCVNETVTSYLECCAYSAEGLKALDISAYQLLWDYAVNENTDGGAVQLHFVLAEIGSRNPEYGRAISAELYGKGLQLAIRNQLRKFFTAYEDLAQQHAHLNDAAEMQFASVDDSIKGQNSLWPLMRTGFFARVVAR